jgi:Ala-tRNA(Pro) deacylase
MTIAPTLQKYLADHEVAYDLVPHQPTESSLRTAEACHIPGERLAKAILLRDPVTYWLAVVPASRRIRLPDLKAEIGGPIDLASEAEVSEVFPDCARGAIPPVGPCYRLEVIVDESIDRQPDLYFEGGDHQTLVHLSQSEFARLNPHARHGRFSTQPAAAQPRA